MEYQLITEKNNIHEKGILFGVQATSLFTKSQGFSIFSIQTTVVDICAGVSIVLLLIRLYVKLAS